MRTLLFLIIIINISLAQNFPTLDGYVATDSSKIDVAAINKTAQQLKDNGLEPLVIFVDGSIGHSLNDASNYLNQAIEHYSLSDNPNRAVIFVGTNPLVFSDGERPLYIEYSDVLAPVLESQSGSDKIVDIIRNRVIVPKLAAGDFTGAVQAGLSDINKRYLESQGISTGQRLPTTNPSQSTTTTTTTPTPATDNNFALGLFFLVAIPILALLFFRSRKRPGSSRAITAEEAELGQLLSEKRAKIDTDIIELTESENADNYFPPDPEKQHNMKAIIDLLKDERADELAELKTNYQENYDLLANSKRKYDALVQEEEASEHDLEEFKSYVPEYEQILNNLEEVKVFAGSLADKRDNLKTEIAQINQRTKVVEDLLHQSKDVYAKLYLKDWPEAKEVYYGFDEALYEIKNIEETKPFAALEKLKILEQDLQTVNDSVSEIRASEKEFVNFEPWLKEKRDEGYRLENVDKLSSDLKEQITLAKNLLQQNEYKVLGAQVEGVSELADDLFVGSRHFVSLFKENQERFDKIEADSQRVKKNIEKAAIVFDIVDDYAPESWADIKGNGSEAQKAAEQAYEFYSKAKELNSFNEQNFDYAADMLDLADAELKRADELSASIEKRLKNLQHAQKTARDELNLVKKDLAKDWDYLKQEKVDRVVGDKAENLMNEAAQYIARVEQEFKQTKPNWLIMMAWIQKADKLVDEALEVIRAEEEAMERRRVIMESEKVEAETALERILEYARVHPNDISLETKQQLENSQAYYLKAIQLEKTSKNLYDDDLTRAYIEAAQSFDQAQQLAELAYKKAEKDFAEMEELRKDAAEAVADAQESYKNLRKIAKRGRVENTVRSSLYALANSIPEYYSSANKAELNGIIQKAKSVENDINQAQSEVRTYIKQVETQRRKERLQMLEAERRRRARQMARQRVSWGSSPIGRTGPIIFSSPPRRTRSRTSNSRMPVSRRPTSVRLPTVRSRPSSHKSGGGWGGGRKSGGGW